MRYSLIGFFMLFTPLLYAQFSVNGKVIDDKKQALGFANIVLLQASDSSFVAGTTSAVDGQFSINTSLAETYILSVSILGYNSYFSELFILNDQNPTQIFEAIALQAGGIALETVEVTAEAPIFERQIDRTVLNLENRVTTTGSSVLEVLERSPGVFVNRSSGAIGMLGKDGVNIMINGKLNYTPPDALLAFLEGLDASNIVKIELITTPPSNFDAQGNAGYINIVLKQGTEEGWRGSYSLSGGYGRGEVAAASLNINYGKGKFGLIGNYSYNLIGHQQNSTIIRNAGDDRLNNTSDRLPQRNTHNASLGLDYKVSNTTTIGVLFSGYSNQWDMDAFNTIKQGPELDTTITSINTEINDWNHFQANINLAQQFKNGSSLSADIDYLFYDNDNPTTYFLQYETDQIIFQEENVFSTKATPFDIQVGKIDYAFPVSTVFKWSSGLKYVQSNFENDVLVEQDGVRLGEFSSANDLTENIFAAYTDFDYQFHEKWRLKAGLRYEHTDTDLEDEEVGKVVDRNFGSFFPSVFLNYKMNDQNNLNVSYSRRINRPAFTDMAPFIIFLGPRTSFGGNTALQPAIANTFQVDYRFKAINFSVQYTDEDSTIVRFQNRIDPATNTQLIVPDNLSSQQIFSASVAFPVTVTKWWDMRIFSMYLWQRVTTVEPLGTFIDRQDNIRLNSTQTFTLPQQFKIELSGFYQTPSLMGNVRFEPFYILNFGIQKQFKNKSRLTFNITDLLDSIVFEGTTEIADEAVFISRTSDFSQRTFKLTYSTTFGNQKVKGARKRESGKEEKGRVN